MRGASTSVPAAVVAGLGLAGCGGGGQSGGTLAELTVPAAYDPGCGWALELGWVQEQGWGQEPGRGQKGAGTAPVAVAPASVTAASAGVGVGSGIRGSGCVES